MGREERGGRRRLKMSCAECPSCCWTLDSSTVVDMNLGSGYAGYIPISKLVSTGSDTTNCTMGVEAYRGSYSFKLGDDAVTNDQPQKHLPREGHVS